MNAGAINRSRRRRIERRAKLARAFSLVEILVAVIVLGLGLLGLAALFPVVIREQRIGTDNVTGVLVGNAARATLKTMNWDQAATGSGANVWAALRDSADDDALGGNGGDRGAGELNDLGRWVVPEVRTSVTSFYHPGSTMIGDPGTPTGRAGIQLGSRLYPSQGEPQFVWDIAVQRVSDFNLSTPSQFDTVRCAVFVRRIDQRIRLAEGETLRSSLLSPATAANRRLPIAENANGLPTGDGIGGGTVLRYGMLRTANVYGGQVIRDILRTTGSMNVGTGGRGAGTALIVDTSRTDGAMLAQAGQKIVDNLGNVYTVARVRTEEGGGPNRARLDLSPQIPEQAFLKPMEISNGALKTADTNPRLRQFVFAAQPPAAVVLTEVYP